MPWRPPPPVLQMKTGHLAALAGGKEDAWRVALSVFGLRYWQLESLVISRVPYCSE